jgi:hypothetical protein
VEGPLQHLAEPQPHALTATEWSPASLPAESQARSRWGTSLNMERAMWGGAQ